jgi:hypothetical protein
MENTMRAIRSGRHPKGILGTAVVAILMIAAFALLGGIGPQGNTVQAAAATSIQSISVNSTCDPTAGGFAGTVTLNGTFSGSITLGLFYHVPGGSQFVYSGVSTTASFAGTSTATYAFTPFTFAGANSYRIQVLDSGGLGGSTVKSNSVPPCTPTTTTTTTTTSTTTTSTTTTSTTTTGTTTTGTTTTGTTT